MTIDWADRLARKIAPCTSTCGNRGRRGRPGGFHYSDCHAELQDEIAAALRAVAPTGPSETEIDITCIGEERRLYFNTVTGKTRCGERLATLP